MIQTDRPSKYLIRAYLERRAHDSKPPPTPEEIRRQLGWGMQMFEQRLTTNPRRA
jgi:hypothetical protein